MESVASLPRLLRAFQAATRWTLRYLPSFEAGSPAGQAWSVPVYSGEKAAAGFLALQQEQDAAERGPQVAEKRTGRAAPTPEFPGAKARAFFPRWPRLLHAVRLPSIATLPEPWPGRSPIC